MAGRLLGEEGLEGVAEVFEGIVHATEGGIEGDVEVGCDFVEGDVFGAQEEDIALWGGEGMDGLAEEVVEVMACEQFGGKHGGLVGEGLDEGGGVGIGGGDWGIEEEIGTMTAKFIDDEIARDAEEPSAKVAAMEAVGFLEDAHPGFLEEVFEGGGGGGPAGEECTQRGGMPQDEGIHGRDVALVRIASQEGGIVFFVVVGLGGLGGHGLRT